MTLTSGTRIGPYEVVATLGVGGMGEVYRARDTRLGREVALKLLPREVACDAERVRRFNQEARAASSLKHPNILTVHDVGESDGAPYMVAELLDGQSLRDRLAQGPLPWRRALEQASELARGLAAAHEQGIVHRDLKPDNLFITADGHLKILDFGLAKVQGEAEPTGTLTDGTAPGSVLGTAGYMAPEQVRGLPADHRADLFAFGAILYEMIRGERAFPGESAIDRAMAILRDEPRAPDPADPNFPVSIWRIIQKCLEKNPRDRVQSARDLGMFLDAIAAPITAPNDVVRPLDDPSGVRGAPQRAPWVMVAVISGLVLIAGLALLPMLREQRRLARGLELATDPRLAEKLEALGQLPRPPSDQPSYQQLTFQQGDVLRARFAPDGRSVVYEASWGGAEKVEIYSVLPGAPESRSLLDPGISLIAVSGHGELLVHLRSDDPEEGKGVLARVPLAGGAPRPIAEKVLDADFGPDGSTILIVRWRDGKTSFEYPMGTPVFETTHHVSHPRVSPDGRRIAFLDHPVMSDDLGSVAVLELGSRQARTLGPRWGSVYGLAWSAAGDEVWFTAAEHGMVRGLRAVDLEGRTRELTRFPANVILHDVARDGRALISRDYQRAVVEAFDAEEEQVRDLSWFDWTFPLDLSADGHTLLFLESGQASGASYLTYIRNLDGSPAVRLGQGIGNQLSADGRWVLFMPGNLRDKLVLLPTGVGETRPIEPGPITRYTRAVWLDDERSILFAGAEADHGLRLYRQALDGSPPRAISPDGYSLLMFTPSPVSRDKKTVLAHDPSGEVVLFPLEGGAPKPVPHLRRRDKPIAWTADGHSLYVLECCHVDSPITRLDLASGERESVLHLSPQNRVGVVEGLKHVFLSRDGGTYVYQYVRTLSDLFLIEGL